MDFRGAAQERAGLKPPLPHPFLLVALGHHQRGRKAGGGGSKPSSLPQKVSCGIPVGYTHGWGRARPRRLRTQTRWCHLPQGSQATIMVLGGEQLSKTTGGPKSLGLPPPHIHPMLPLQQSSRKSPQPLGEGPRRGRPP